MSASVAASEVVPRNNTTLDDGDATHAAARVDGTTEAMVAQLEVSFHSSSICSTVFDFAGVRRPDTRLDANPHNATAACCVDGGGMAPSPAAHST